MAALVDLAQIGNLHPGVALGGVGGGGSAAEQHVTFKRVKTVADLDKRQRPALAGAYWISPQGAASAPMPLDLANFASRLWSQGIVDGKIPATYKGKQLSLDTIRDQTKIRMVGFYGGRDELVPDATAKPLKKAMGSRYRHVVDPEAGHIAFVMSSAPWRVEQNPATVICQEYDKTRRVRACKTTGAKTPAVKTARYSGKRCYDGPP